MVRPAMHPLAHFAAALALAVLGSACTTPPPAPVVATPPPLNLPPPAPVVAGITPTFPAPHLPPGPAQPGARASRSGRPSRAPTLDEVAAHASGIYLARVDRADGFAHFIVTEIWRADPGRNIAVGDDVQTNPERQDPPGPPAFGAEQAVVYFFSPHLVRADGTQISRGSDRAFGGRVLSSGLTIAETRARLK